MKIIKFANVGWPGLRKKSTMQAGFIKVEMITGPTVTSESPWMKVLTQGNIFSDCLWGDRGKVWVTGQELHILATKMYSHS